MPRLLFKDTPDREGEVRAMREESREKSAPGPHPRPSAFGESCPPRPCTRGRGGQDKSPLSPEYRGEGGEMNPPLALFLPQPSPSRKSAPAPMRQRIVSKRPTLSSRD